MCSVWIQIGHPGLWVQAAVSPLFGYGKGEQVGKKRPCNPSATGKGATACDSEDLRVLAGDLLIRAVAQEVWR